MQDYASQALRGTVALHSNLLLTLITPKTLFSLAKAISNIFKTDFLRHMSN